MRIFRRREDSLRFGLSFFLILGAVLGTVFCNGMREEMKLDLCILGRQLISETTLSRIRTSDLFLRIWPKRLWILAVLCVLVSTRFSGLFLLLISGYLGGSVSMFLCPLTMEYGIWSPWKFLLLMFPQCIVYGLLSYVLLWWMPLQGKRLTGISVLLFCVGITLGAVLESLINPWFLQFL